MINIVKPLIYDDYKIMTDIKKIKKNDSADSAEVVKPIKTLEFEKFLELIGRNSVGHWIQIAKVLNVDRDTIAAWKKHPLAQKVIRDEIDRAMEGMEKAGGSDWRMWESKLKMLNISPIEKNDVTSNGETVNIGVISYADAIKKNVGNNNTP